MLREAHAYEKVGVSCPAVRGELCFLEVDDRDGARRAEQDALGEHVPVDDARAVDLGDLPNELARDGGVVGPGRDGMISHGLFSNSVVTTTYPDVWPLRALNASTSVHERHEGPRRRYTSRSVSNAVLA